MTLVIIGPVTKDKIKKGDYESSHVGGASYFQSFVFDSLDIDYVAIINLSDFSLLDEFPNRSRVIPIAKEDTHFFINHYPDENNLDIRHQYSNFADIEITQNDLANILENISNLEAIILNPLNKYDFSLETVEYIKSFNVPVYIAIQGFLRDSNNNEVVLSNNNDLIAILNGVEAMFLDETEFNIVFGEDISKFNVSEIVVTNGHLGSRVITKNQEISINAVKNNSIVDSTGCGDTYLAAYVSKRIVGESVKKSAKFASLIASKKLSVEGPYK